MSYRKFLDRQEERVLPYFGGDGVDAPERRLRAQGASEPGFWRFLVKGRLATALERSEPPDLSALPAVRGHLAGEWLVREGAVAEHVHFLPPEQPPRLSPCLARRWASGEMLFDSLPFESEAEEAARRAMEEGGM